MGFFSFPRTWTDTAVRISAVVILGPALYLFFARFLKPGQEALASMGWLTVLAGVCFFAMFTIDGCITAFANPAQKTKTTEAYLCIIALGLAQVTPYMDLMVYFTGIGMLSAALAITGAFIIPMLSKPKDPTA